MVYVDSKVDVDEFNSNPLQDAFCQCGNSKDREEVVCEDCR